MCSEHEFCHQCAPDAFMVAWTQGRHHKRPTFGDYAQQHVAILKRLEVFGDLWQVNSAAAMEFPEFLRMHHQKVYDFARSVQAHFDHFVARIPEFAHFSDAEDVRRSGAADPLLADR